MPRHTRRSRAHECRLVPGGHKVVIPALGSLALILVAGCAGMGGGAAGLGSSGGLAPILPPVASVDVDGPFSVVVDETAGPDGDAWVYRPANLDQLGVAHPVFVWGPGAGATPASYRDHLTRIVSHGFIVYSIVSTGNGSEMTEALDWLLAENGRSSSPYYGKLDPSRMGLGGHSRGSLSTFGAAADPRIVTTIHVAGGSFDGNGPTNLHHPAAYIAGEADALATPNATRDYANTTVPVFYTIMDDVGHSPAAREGLGVMVDWLRWQLGGEEDRRSQFLGDNCGYCTGRYVTQSKNW